MISYIFVIISISYMLLFNQSINAAECPSKGEFLPDLTVSAPRSNTEKDYLGLSDKSSFKLSQIKADIVILEIFSMYCPYCQKEAPLVNDLFNLINSRQNIKDKIKIIGIGAGNTPFEVEVFKNQYNIHFPIFPDESFDVHKAVGEVRTPYFFVFKINPDGSNKLLYSKVGSIHDPNQFLDQIIKESSLQ